MVTRNNSKSNKNNNLNWNSKRARLQASVNNFSSNTLFIPENLSSKSSKSGSIQALQQDVGYTLAIDTLEAQSTNLLQKWVNQSTDTITFNLNNAIDDIQNGLASDNENVS